MKKIIELFSKIPFDKLLHNTLSLHIFLVTACIMHLVSYDKTSTICISAVVTFCVTLFKEVWDDIEGTGSESEDWAADVIGICIAIGYTLILI